MDAYDELKQVILPIIATGVKETSFEPVGTCWIFCAAERDAFAFSAAHVFQHVVQKDKVNIRPHPTMPPDFLPVAPRQISLKSSKLNAFYLLSKNNGFLLDIPHVWTDPTLDVAVCWLRFSESVPVDYKFTRRLAIHAGPVAEGDDIVAIGCGEMGKSKTYGKVAQFYSAITMASGQCVQYKTYGIRGVSGPSFETTSETRSGMSGGPIIHRSYGEDYVSSGVISKSGLGATICASLWPAFSFKFPENQFFYNNQPIKSVLDLIRFGGVDDRTDSLKHFEMKDKHDGNGYLIRWK